MTLHSFLADGLARGDSIAYMAWRLNKSEEEVRMMVEPSWFPATVVWTSVSTLTFATAFPGDVSTRHLVVGLDRYRVPKAVYKDIELDMRETAMPSSGDRIVFRCSTKLDERKMVEHLTSKTLSLRIELMHTLLWCRQDDYSRAAAEAKNCPCYRLVCRRERQGQPVPNPIKRCWVTPTYTTEEEQWKGFDLTCLRDFLASRRYTKYDRPVYQYRTNGTEWVDCENPLAQELLK